MNDLIEQITDDIAAGDEIDETPYVEKFLHLSEKNFREYIDEQWEFIRGSLSDEYFVNMVPESEMTFCRNGTMTNCSYVIEPPE